MRKIDKMEVWKGIIGFEGLYAVSNYGRVLAYEKTRVMPKGGIRTYPETILKQVFNHRGYPIVNLYIDGTMKQFFVSRLVAQAFIPNPDNLPQVCHNDDNPENNHVENLYWGTNKDNQDDSHRKGRHSKPKRPVTAYQICRDMLTAEWTKSFYGTFESTREASRQTGCNQSNVCKVLSGEIRQTKGFIFEYKN